MAFSDLAIELQNIYIQDFDMFAKIISFTIIIFLSCFYLFYFKKKESKSKILTLVFSRVVLTGSSIGILFCSPVYFYLLRPEVSFFTFYEIYLTLYMMFVSLLAYVIGFDIFRYGIPVLLQKAGGLDMHDPDVDRLVKQYFKGKNE